MSDGLDSTFGTRLVMGQCGEVAMSYGWGIRLRMETMGYMLGGDGAGWRGSTGSAIDFGLDLIMGWGQVGPFKT